MLLSRIAPLIGNVTTVRNENGDGKYNRVE
jgi:hypothetical protein